MQLCAVALLGKVSQEKKMGLSWQGEEILHPRCRPQSHICTWDEMFSLEDQCDRERVRYTAALQVLQLQPSQWCRDERLMLTYTIHICTTQYALVINADKVCRMSKLLLLKSRKFSYLTALIRFENLACWSQLPHSGNSPLWKMTFHHVSRAWNLTTLLFNVHDNHYWYWCQSQYTNMDCSGRLSIRLTWNTENA